MNKKINQTCQKINYQDVLNKKLYPAWFFTNERINRSFSKLKENKGIKKVFSIGGGGDFAFSLLSSQSLEINEVNICDIRQVANISIDFKIALLKSLRHEEFLSLFLRQDSFHKNKVYQKIRKTITPLSRKVFDFIIKNSKEEDFFKCLKKSGLWYKNSFWQIKNKTEYLSYLASEEEYYFLQKNLNKITIFSGDFNENLKLFQDNYYNLIYVSNIFDSKKYCRESDLYLQTIKNKLTQRGLIFVVTQNSPKKIIKLIEKAGFSIFQKELHKFNIISSVLGHYSYSFLLFIKD